MSTEPLRVPWYLRLAPIAASLALFLVACALPAVYFDKESHPSWPGIMPLVIGVFGLFMGQIGWLANPVYALALLFPLFRMWVTTAVLASIAFVLALFSITLIGSEIPLDEAGVNTANATGFGPGFFVWLASLLLLAGGAVALKLYEMARSSPR